MTSLQPTVFIVDDDGAVRHCLAVICQLADLPCETYADAGAFIQAYRPDRGGCLVVDQRMPGMSGLELQEWIARQDLPLPVILITGHGDVPLAVTAFRAGAWDFLEKPFDDEYFVARVRAAMARDAATRRTAAERARAATRNRRLSRREQAVMELLVRGLPNKLIAAELDIGIRTVESHRANVLKKMGVASLSELTRLKLLLDSKDGQRD
jgi:two-component system response regulator FixJ